MKYASRRLPKAEARPEVRVDSDRRPLTISGGEYLGDESR